MILMNSYYVVYIKFCGVLAIDVFVKKHLNFFQGRYI